MTASVWLVEVPDMCGESYEVVSVHRAEAGANKYKEENYEAGWGKVQAVVSEYTLHD